MGRINLALDIGTRDTSVYVGNQGGVLHEPTLNTDTGRDAARYPS